MGNKDEEPRQPYITDLSSSNAKNCFHRTIPPAFTSIWSFSFPTTISPIPRANHWTVYFSERDCAVIGYGESKTKTLFNDIWILNFDNYVYEHVSIKNPVQPRTESKAVRFGDRIVVFGGQIGPNYVSDLHFIDLNTGEIIIPNISGPQPLERSGHCMGIYDNRLVVWGGFNSTYLSDLWELDLNRSDLMWKQIDSDSVGRAQAGCAMLNEKMYIIGSSKSDAVLSYDILGRSMEALVPVGNLPPADVPGALTVAIDRYIIFIGGVFESHKFTMMRGYDTVRKWWFVFYITPDGITTTIEDGTVDKNGIFEIPRISNGSIVYREKQRKIAIFLGAPYDEAMAIYEFKVDAALSYLHIQTDMFEMSHLFSVQ